MLRRLPTAPLAAPPAIAAPIPDEEEVTVGLESESGAAKAGAARRARRTMEEAERILDD